MSSDSDDDFLSVSPALKKQLDAVQQRVNARLVSEANERQERAESAAARSNAITARQNARFLKRRGKGGAAQPAILSPPPVAASKPRQELVLDPATNKFFKTTVTTLTPNDGHVLAPRGVTVMTDTDPLIARPKRGSQSSDSSTAAAGTAAAPLPLPLLDALRAHRPCLSFPCIASSTAASSTVVAVHASLSTPLQLAAPGTSALAEVAPPLTAAAGVPAVYTQRPHCGATPVPAAAAAVLSRALARASSCGRPFASALWFPAPRPWPMRPTTIAITPPIEAVVAAISGTDPSAHTAPSLLSSSAAGPAVSTLTVAFLGQSADFVVRPKPLLQAPPYPSPHPAVPSYDAAAQPSDWDARLVSAHANAPPLAFLAPDLELLCVHPVRRPPVPAQLQQQQRAQARAQSDSSSSSGSSNEVSDSDHSDSGAGRRRPAAAASAAAAAAAAASSAAAAEQSFYARTFATPEVPVCAVAHLSLLVTALNSPSTLARQQQRGAPPAAASATTSDERHSWAPVTAGARRRLLRAWRLDFEAAARQDARAGARATATAAGGRADASAAGLAAQPQTQGAQAQSAAAAATVARAAALHLSAAAAGAAAAAAGASLGITEPATAEAPPPLTTRTLLQRVHEQVAACATDGAAVYGWQSYDICQATTSSTAAPEEAAAACLRLRSDTLHFNATAVPAAVVDAPTVFGPGTRLRTAEPATAEDAAAALALTPSPAADLCSAAPAADVTLAPLPPQPVLLRAFTGEFAPRGSGGWIELVAAAFTAPASAPAPARGTARAAPVWECIARAGFPGRTVADAAVPWGYTARAAAAAAWLAEHVAARARACAEAAAAALEAEAQGQRSSDEWLDDTCSAVPHEPAQLTPRRNQERYQCQCSAARAAAAAWSINAGVAVVLPPPCSSAPAGADTGASARSSVPVAAAAPAAAAPAVAAPAVAAPAPPPAPLLRVYAAVDKAVSEVTWPHSQDRVIHSHRASTPGSGPQSRPVSSTRPVSTPSRRTLALSESDVLRLAPTAPHSLYPGCVLAGRRNGTVELVDTRVRAPRRGADAVTTAAAAETGAAVLQLARLGGAVSWLHACGEADLIASAARAAVATTGVATGSLWGDAPAATFGGSTGALVANPHWFAAAATDGSVCIGDIRRGTDTAAAAAAGALPSAPPLGLLSPEWSRSVLSPQPAVLFSLRGHPSSLLPLRGAFNSRESVLFLGGGDGAVRAWSLHTGALVAEVSVVPVGWLLSQQQQQQHQRGGAGQQRHGRQFGDGSTGPGPVKLTGTGTHSGSVQAAASAPQSVLGGVPIDGLTLSRRGPADRWAVAPTPAVVIGPGAAARLPDAFVGTAAGTGETAVWMHPTTHPTGGTRAGSSCPLHPAAGTAEFSCPGCRMAAASSAADAAVGGAWGDSLDRSARALVRGAARQGVFSNAAPVFSAPRVSFACAWDPTWRGLFVAHEVELETVAVPPLPATGAPASGAAADGGKAVVMKGGVSAFHFPDFV